MNDEIMVLEERVRKLGMDVSVSLESSEMTCRIMRDYYKDLMIALKIIQKQKMELLELEIKLHDAKKEILVKDIIRFCNN